MATNITLTRRPAGRAERKRAITFFLFVSPALLGLVLLLLGPMVASFVYSLSNYQLGAPFTFVGLANWVAMIHDPLVWTSLGVTTYYAVVGVPIRLAIQLGIAMLLVRGLRGTNLFRTLIYLPSMIAGVSVSVLWLWIFNPQFGLLNMSLSFLHISGPNWLQDPHWVVASLIIMTFWDVGPGVIINIAGLKGIPSELYEAATVDGAGIWSRFRRVTLPMVTPVLFFNLVTGVIASFQTFTQAYVMTQGGPSNASLFYVLYLFQNAFSFFKLGYASALAWFLFLIILALTLLIFATSRRWVYYED